jgi:hypothetical protein
MTKSSDADDLKPSEISKQRGSFLAPGIRTPDIDALRANEALQHAEHAAPKFKVVPSSEETEVSILPETSDENENHRTPIRVEIVEEAAVSPDQDETSVLDSPEVVRQGEATRSVAMTPPAADPINVPIPEILPAKEVPTSVIPEEIAPASNIIPPKDKTTEITPIETATPQVVEIEPALPPMDEAAQNAVPPHVPSDSERAMTEIADIESKRRTLETKVAELTAARKRSESELIPLKENWESLSMRLENVETNLRMSTDKRTRRANEADRWNVVEARYRAELDLVSAREKVESILREIQSSEEEYTALGVRENEIKKRIALFESEIKDVGGACSTRAVARDRVREGRGARTQRKNGRRATRIR